MLKSCQYCGRIHDSKYDCGKKPKRRYGRVREESGRYTHAWNVKSEEIKSRSNYLCSVCLDEGKFTYEDLETHHIAKLRERPELLLEDSNLICLCRRHHEEAERGVISQERLWDLAKKRDKTYPLHEI